jgi:hypothetical protein
MAFAKITDQHRDEVCKIGQRAECCRFLIYGDGFECAKNSSLHADITARVVDGSMGSRGDNCGGL